MGDYQTGTAWRYRTIRDYDSSRLVIGAYLEFEGSEPVICCAALQAPVRQPDGSYCTGTIPFVPLTMTAFRQSALTPDGHGALPAEFQSSLQNWQNDPRGLTVFTVPFDGSLERLIARQMAQIVETKAANG